MPIDLTEDPENPGLMGAGPMGTNACPTRWERSFARKDITTVVILDRDWPSSVEEPDDPYIRRDRPGMTLYGEEPYERLDLWTRDDFDLRNMAGRILATRKASVSLPRISRAYLDASYSDFNVDLLSTLSVFLPSRYECRLQNSRGEVFDAQFFATGVVEEFGAEAWTAEISLDRAKPYEVLLSTDWVWDSGTWDHVLWS